MKLQSLLFGIFFITITSCLGQSSHKINTLSVVAFSKKMRQTTNPQVIDIRTPKEYSEEHIANAKNENWLNTHFETDMSKYDKTKPVFIYCKNGSRSYKAKEKLAEMGFLSIFELEGGILKWNEILLGRSPDNKSTDEKKNEKKKNENNKTAPIANNKDIFLNSDKKVLFFFYSESCDSCDKMLAYLSNLGEDLYDKLLIIHLDSEKNRCLVSELNITAFPTLLLYENKTLKWRNSGFINEKDLKKRL